MRGHSATNPSSEEGQIAYYINNKNSGQDRVWFHVPATLLTSFLHDGKKSLHGMKVEQLGPWPLEAPSLQHITLNGKRFLLVPEEGVDR